MENVGYVAYARADQLERGVDVSANNIANANTAGFKAKQTLFESLTAATPGDSVLSSVTYAIDKGTITDTASGSVTYTGNALDLAVTGGGWLAYLTTEGQMALGREGALVASAEGDLMTPAGDMVLDIGGAPINIPPGSTDLSIAHDGTVSSAEEDVIAQIGVFDAPGIETWAALRGSMMVPRDGGIDLVPALEPGLMQGHVEGSNVNAITEMSRMIKLQRAYEQAMTVATTADGLRKDTISRLGSVA